MVTGQTIRKGRPCQSGRIGENGGLGGRLGQHSDAGAVHVDSILGGAVEIACRLRLALARIQASAKRKP